MRPGEADCSLLPWQRSTIAAATNTFARGSHIWWRLPVKTADARRRPPGSFILLIIDYPVDFRQGVSYLRVVGVCFTWRL